ncbi:MAG: sodium:proton antiporter NhaD [Alphaproteobacteria bacterium]
MSSIALYPLMFSLSLLALIFPSLALASGGGGGEAALVEAVTSTVEATISSGGTRPHIIHAGMHWGGLLCIAIFVLSYLAVLSEEYTHLKKSKPVMLGAGLIWVVIGIIAPEYDVSHEELRKAIFHDLEEYASLLLFLLAAMTYISAMENRKVFEVLKDKLVQAGFSLRQLFWATGIMAFCLSPVADNLTTALVLGAVVMAVGKNDPKFVAISCVNIVNAANAGGAFSPFGDITTLMVWQAEKVSFFEFFSLLLPGFDRSFAVPATIMSFLLRKINPKPLRKNTRLKRGAKPIMLWAS